MAGSAGSIYVDLLLRDANYRQGLNSARSATNSWSKQVNKDVDSATGSFQNVVNPVNNISSAVSRMAGVVAGAFSVSEIVRYSDTWKQLQGRLGLVVDDMEAMTMAQNDLAAVAERTRQPLEGVYNLYTRLAQFVPESERAQYDLLGVTESISAALAITGETAVSSQAAMIQFTQAIGTNFEAAGQELRSLQEQAPRLTKALMSALGDGTKSLQTLKEEGKLTRQSVLNALGGMGEEGRRLAEELAKIPPTTAQAFTALENSFITFIGQSSTVNNLVGAFNQSIRLLADNIDIVALAVGGLSIAITSRLATALSVSQIGKFSSAIKTNYTEIYRYNTALGLAVGANDKLIRSTSLLYTGFLTAGNGLRGIVNLLGGPFAATLTVAAGAIVYLNSQASAGDRVMDKYADTFEKFYRGVDKASDSVEQFSESILTLKIAEARTELQTLSNDLESIGTRIENGIPSLKAYISTFTSFSGLKFTAEIERLGREFEKTQDLEAYKDGVNDLAEQYPQLNDRILEVLRTIAQFETAGQQVKNLENQLKSLANVRIGTEQFGPRERQGPFLKPMNEAQKKTFAEYESLLTGVSEAELKRKKIVEELQTLYGTQEVSQNQINQALARYDAEVAKNSESTKRAKKNAEELKSTFEQYRSIITGVNQEEIDRIRVTEELTSLLGSQYLPTQEALNKALENYRNQRLETTFKRYESVITGVKQEELDRLEVIKELSTLLGSQYIPNQEALNEAIKRYDESLLENKDTVMLWGIDVTDVGKNAAENIQNAFADFLFDPFDQGLDGMLKGFVDTVRRMIAEAQAAQLAKALFGSGVEGGEGSGLLGNLFGGLFSGGFNAPTGLPVRAVSGPAAGSFVLPTFADGGYLGPGKWGIAGEAGAELIYGGRTGATVLNQDQMGLNRGNTYNIDARGADQGAVARIEQSLLALAGPGVIERRVSNAQMRGSL